MRKSLVSPARVAALEVVRLTREREAFAQDIVDSRIDRSSMSREDRAFATKLALGVVSAQGTLDEVLNLCMNSPDDVTADVRDALRISAYEILFLDKSAHAAVDQGVELVRTVAPRAGGVANAVLRRVVTAHETFPFGDPLTDVAASARMHAFPLWLAERLVGYLGFDEASRFMAVSNEQAPVFIAVNAAKARDEEILTLLQRAGCSAFEGRAGGVAVPGCYRLGTGRVLFDGRVGRALSNGMLLVSDAASQAVARLLLPASKPRSFLEIGAGRATKTILLQSNAVRLWGSQIDEYVAVDNHRYKVDLLRRRAEDYGINVSSALACDALRLKEQLGKRAFDVVFVDAPCSGLGTLRRHPEIKWRLEPQVIEDYAQLGLGMLTSASAHVAPGGSLCFATCTITKEENVLSVKRFLESDAGGDFRLVPIQGKPAFLSSLEPDGSDAHFLVTMLRVR